MSTNQNNLLNLRKKMKETVLELSKEERDAIHTGEAMEALVKDKRWEFYEKVLRAGLDLARAQGEGDRLPEEDGMAYALRMERIKGTIIGIRLALEQPSIMIRVGNDLHKQLLGAGKDTK